MSLYIGIDCGTQGTKVIIYDSQKKHIEGEGYAPHQLITNENGSREQDPQWWIGDYVVGDIGATIYPS